jgi:hypothetical protein
MWGSLGTFVRCLRLTRSAPAREREHDSRRSPSLGGGPQRAQGARQTAMIRKLKSGGYRLYSRKVNPKTGRRRNLGTFKTRAAAEKHERAVQYFKRH